MMLPDLSAQAVITCAPLCCLSNRGRVYHIKICSREAFNQPSEHPKRNPKPVLSQRVTTTSKLFQTHLKHSLSRFFWP